ncbi:alpha/beta hydrolase [Heyndrickxia acidicola]|uniref:Alpha/beta hydrolase n=1 Tax=Heyndrickxia acidicola TaxID=209389 RepID=A0ABU6MGR0_9BACI|nr:alpha/beta hydrolase [Heyndrickxia acidicola]MED1203474.1 alpha/beta hydrolase [Heyndrickxia acidicola]
MADTFTEEEIEIKGKTAIHGTLTIPSSQQTERFPAVLFLAGSGPIDRNGNGPKGKYQFNLYKELAERIAGFGFVTFRYDKRGTGRSKEKLVSAGLWDLVEDAEESYLFLKNHPNVDPARIVVLGHSEGTIIGTALSERQEIGGLLLASGGAANLNEFLSFQRKLSYKELMNAKGLKGLLARKLVNVEKQEMKVQKWTDKMIHSNKDVYKVLFFFKQPAKWMREHFAYDTRSALRKLDCPVMAISGDKDPLVEPELIGELPSLVKGPSASYYIKDMEHGLRVQHEERSILKAKKMYSKLVERPLSPEGLEAISQWLNTHFKEGVSVDH